MDFYLGIQYNTIQLLKHKQRKSTQMLSGQTDDWALEYVVRQGCDNNCKCYKLSFPMKICPRKRYQSK